MSLFDGLLSKASAALTGVESTIGIPPPAADSQAWVTDLTRWHNILKSLDASMNAHDGASDLSGAIRVWESGPHALALAAIAALQTGVLPYSKAQALYVVARDGAQALQSSMQTRWAQFAARGVPTAADFVKAPYTAATEAASRAGTAAAAALEPALGGLSNFGKYAPWALGGFALLYLSSFLPRSGRR